MSSPNIILIQADQLTALALNTYGNSICYSPTINGLADQGVVFENMYCNFPLCAPSRYSMMSGQLASRIGAFDNAAEFPASIPTIAHYLRDLDYRTCLSGKMHFVGPDQLHGFEERLTSDIYPADFQWSANWESETHVDVTDTRGVTKSGPCEDSVQIRYDRRVTNATLNYLKGAVVSKDNRPLFMTVSYTHPHDPFVCTQEYWDLYNDIEIPLPRVNAFNDKDYDPHSKKILTQAGLYGVKFSNEQIKSARRGYYGSISFFDAQIMQIKSTLDELGLAENTVIIITSDHGEMLGERGMWFKKNFYEPAVRVPLIVHYPKKFKAQRIAIPVSLVDVLPTVAALGNDGNCIKTCEPLDGNNLVPLMTDQHREWNAPVICEILSEGVTAPSFMIRKGDYKYIHSSEYDPILFNLADDPNELVNLAGRVEIVAIEKEFTDEISKRWDEEALSQKILKDQRRRLMIQRTLTKGKYTSWDFETGDGDEHGWFRGQTSYSEWAFDYTPASKNQEQ